MTQNPKPTNHRRAMTKTNHSAKYQPPDNTPQQLNTERCMAEQGSPRNPNPRWPTTFCITRQQQTDNGIHFVIQFTSHLHFVYCIFPHCKFPQCFKPPLHPPPVRIRIAPDPCTHIVPTPRAQLELRLCPHSAPTNIVTVL